MQHLKLFICFQNNPVAGLQRRHTKTAVSPLLIVDTERLSAPFFSAYGTSDTRRALSGVMTCLAISRIVCLCRLKLQLF